MNRTDQFVTLSVIVPAFREERRIGNVLRAAIGYFQQHPLPHEIIVVDDGSPDKTADAARSFQTQEPSLRVIRCEVNRGKGAAVRTGMEAANGEFALFADADNSTPFEEVAKLLPVAEAGADIVMGSRYLPGSELAKKQPLLRRVMSRVGNLLFRIMLGLPYADTRCGFKLYSRRARRTVFPKQTLERFGFDTELLVIAREHGLDVREVPVRWFDSAAESTVTMKDSLGSLKEVWTIFQKKRKGIYAPTLTNHV